MKQGSLDVDRLKSEGRHCFQRRKMLKNSPILNGDSENMDRTLARELNFAVAAAFHDHLTCNKASSQEFCSIDNVPKVNNLSLEATDHIYANSTDIKNKSNVINNPSTPQETPNEFPTSLDGKHRERRMCLLRKRLPKPSIEAVKSNGQEAPSESKLNLNCSPCNLPTGSQHTSLKTPILATRYFGRRSKTVPSRALKRRYLGPPKMLPIKKEIVSAPSPVPSDVPDNDSINQELLQINNSTPLLPKTHKKRGRKPKLASSAKPNHLATNSEYFLPDLHPPPDTSPTNNIDVPLWKLKPVTSFYQMEGTENINDCVFQRRHMKCEQDERRRKRWDMQRLREQKASQKLKYKNCRGKGKIDNSSHKKSRSFYPDPKRIEHIEVTESLPVIAFGCCTIPNFQPSEFSLPWFSGQSSGTPEGHSSISSRGRKSRHSTPRAT